MADPADTQDMTITQTIKDILHLTDTSFDVVADGHRTTADEMAARGYDTLDWLSPFVDGVPPVVEPEPDGMTDIVERTWVDGADLSDLPPLMLTMDSGLSPELITAATPRPSGRHFARS